MTLSPFLANSEVGSQILTSWGVTTLTTVRVTSPAVPLVDTPTTRASANQNRRMLILP